jgi:hypothetical protein
MRELIPKFWEFSGHTFFQVDKKKKMKKKFKNGEKNRIEHTDRTIISNPLQNPRSPREIGAASISPGKSALISGPWH